MSVIFDEQEQKNALKALKYELNMFNICYGFLVSMESNTIIKNIVVEAFLLHARNIIYFLEDKIRKSDIRCSNFGINKTIINLPMDNSLEMINQYLSHLTQARMKQKPPEWKCWLIKKEINEGLENSGVNGLIKNSKNI